MRQAVTPENFYFHKESRMSTNDDDPFAGIEAPSMPSSASPHLRIVSINPVDVMELPPSLPPPPASASSEQKDAVKEQEEAPQEESTPPVAAAPEAEMPKETPKVEAPKEAPQKMRVGRDPGQNDWVIDNQTVSRQHAVLTLEGDKIRVEDLGSSTGTAVLDRHSGWSRVQPNFPVSVSIGTRVRFGGVETTSTIDTQGKTHLHYVEENKPSRSQIFFWKGEELSGLERLEQSHVDPPIGLTSEENERLVADHDRAMNDGVEEAEFTEASPTDSPRETPKAEAPKETPKAEAPKRPHQSSDTSFRDRHIGLIAIASMLALGALLSFLILYRGGERDTTTVATRRTVPAAPPSRDANETSAGTERTEPSEPDSTSNSTVPTPCVENTPPEEPAPVVTNPGYTCRPGHEVTTCDNVRDFLLARAENSAFWDCSRISLDEYRDLYRVEDPNASPRVVIANTCACQYCEPTARN